MYVLREPPPTAEARPPLADELEAVYATLGDLWDTLHALRVAGVLTDEQNAHADTEAQVVLLARAIVHRHFLVTLFPNQYPEHYRTAQANLESEG